MDPSVLRSRLCYAVEELQFLTTQELAECNWTIIQRVFSILFEKSRSLREYSDRIGDLMETRNVELQNRKMAPENKNGWKDKNANFKTSFMRIIIDGLSYLRWPPSLVAFSDPLEKLLSDPKDAIAFVLEFGIEVEVTRHTRLKKNDLPSSPVSRKTITEDDQDSRIVVSPRQMSFSSGIGSNDQHNTIRTEDRHHDSRETRRPLSARRGEKPRPSSGSSQKVALNYIRIKVEVYTTPKNE